MVSKWDENRANIGFDCGFFAHNELIRHRLIVYN